MLMWRALPPPQRASADLSGKLRRLHLLVREMGADELCIDWSQREGTSRAEAREVEGLSFPEPRSDKAGEFISQ